LARAVTTTFILDRSWWSLPSVLMTAATRRVDAVLCSDVPTVIELR